MAVQDQTATTDAPTTTTTDSDDSYTVPASRVAASLDDTATVKKYESGNVGVKVEEPRTLFHSELKPFGWGIRSVLNRSVYLQPEDN